MAVGAELSLVNIYVGEVAPRRDRAKWTSVIFVNSAAAVIAQFALNTRSRRFEEISP
jgi:MFS transporter, putative metabolite:H+ symporter